MADLKILVLGARGMLGSAMLRELAARGLAVLGTVRGDAGAVVASASAAPVMGGVDAQQFGTIEEALEAARPRLVVNCIGIVKQRREAQDPVSSIEVNALFPHRLAAACRTRGIRVIHFSSDCVFSGAKGRYRESDTPDPVDLYGRSKLLGEVEGPGTLTLRTSIIGHELSTRHGLLEWFLSQREGVRGFTRAIWSGLPTVEVARVVAEHVLPRPDLSGVYHVSAEPISKHDLLHQIAAEYGVVTPIAPVAEPACDRSLDASRFQAATGYAPPHWPELVARMHRDHLARRDHGNHP